MGIMLKYIIEAEYTKKFTKFLTVYAKSEDEAQEKAEEIIGNWDDVQDIDVSNIVEE